MKKILDFQKKILFLSPLLSVVLFVLLFPYPIFSVEGNHHFIFQFLWKPHNLIYWSFASYALGLIYSFVCFAMTRNVIHFRFFYLFFMATLLVILPQTQYPYDTMIVFPLHALYTLGSLICVQGIIRITASNSIYVGTRDIFTMFISIVITLIIGVGVGDP